MTSLKLFNKAMIPLVMNSCFCLNQLSNNSKQDDPGFVYSAIDNELDRVWIGYVSRKEELFDKFNERKYLIECREGSKKETKYLEKTMHELGFPIDSSGLYLSNKTKVSRYLDLLGWPVHKEIKSKDIKKRLVERFEKM